MADYVKVRDYEKKKTETAMKSSKRSLMDLHNFFPNKTLNSRNVKSALKANLYTTQNLKVLKEHNYIEAFSTKFLNKTLDVKLNKTNFQEGEALMVMVSDKTELIRLKVLEDTDEFKNNIFASFSHELRTPLNCIFLILRVLEEEPSISNDIKSRMIKPMWCSAKILLNMVDNILDYTLITNKKLRLDIQMFDIKELIMRTVDLISVQASEKGLKLNLSFEDDKLMQKKLSSKFHSDSSKIEQILIQLLMNALKFTFKGEITVKVQSTSFLKDSVEISVTDTGIGMSEMSKSNLENNLRGLTTLKTAYSRVANSSTGASLGLSVSHVLAMKLGNRRYGGIKFESELGVGSKFSFIVKNKDKSSEPAQANQTKRSLKIEARRSEHRLFSLNKRQEQPAPGMSTERFKYQKFTEEEKMSFSTGFVFKNLRETDFNHEEMSELRLRHMTSVGDLIPKQNCPKFIEKALGQSPGLPCQILEGFPEKIDDYSPPSKDNDCEHPPILIVDDDNFNIMGLSRLLELKGISSLKANNGQQALDLVKEQVQLRCNCCLQFKLILMDINMPIMDGHEATRNLKAMMEKKEIPSTKIVAVTAYVNDDDKVKCFESGMDDYVSKPLDYTRLERILKKFKINIF